jgi:undecaprenyl-diphosphatase
MDAGLPEPVAHRATPLERYGIRMCLLVLAFVLVTVPFAILLFDVIAEGPLTRVDGSVANWMNTWVHGHPLLVSALPVVGWFGLPLWLGILVTGGSLFVFLKGRRRLATYLVVTVVGGSLVDTAVKLLVNRPRPVVDHPLDTAFGTSFPSGHSMASTLTYGALLLTFLPVLSRRHRIAAVIGATAIVLMIGSSRLLLGVHFLTDVIGGYVLGLAWLFGATALFEVWRHEEGAPPSTAGDVIHDGVEPEAASALRGS